MKINNLIYLLILIYFISGCQSKQGMEMTKEEHDKLGAVHYKSGFDSFFVSKNILDKFESKDRSKKIREQRLKSYKEFKVIVDRYTKSFYTDKALISIARIEEVYISDFEALSHYKKLKDEFPDSKYYFEAYQKVDELKNKFIWKIEEAIYQDEFDYAIMVINRLKIILPELEEAYYYLGLIYEKRGLYEQAIREWQKLKYNPKAHFYLSLAYYDRKIYHKAIKELFSAIELDKDNSIYYYNLAVIYDEMGNEDKANKARDAYLQISQKDPNEKKWVKIVKEYAEKK